MMTFATLPDLSRMISLMSPIFSLASLSRLDDCAALIVADALKREGFNARVTGAEAEINAGNADTICVCFLEEVSGARLSYTVRKFARRVPSATIIVCRLGIQFEAEEEQPRDEDAPRSLASVIAAVAKSANVKTRREQ
jgi:hypothetical protein